MASSISNKVNFLLNSQFKKIKINNYQILFYRGKFFFEDKQINKKNIINFFKKENFNLKKLERKLNGFYIFVLVNLDCIEILTDQVRSYPVFFLADENLLYISDSVEKILKNKKKMQINSHAVGEFLNVGYCLSDATLIENIKQTTSGSIIKLKKIDNIWKLHNKTSLNNKFYSNQITKDKTISMCLKNLDQVFYRMIKANPSATYLIPLSGGYDSRVIAMMLKRHNISKVVCFTYGNFSNEEVQISKYVAKELNYKWKFIKYSENTWARFKNSTLFKNSLSQLGNYSTIPHIQDLPASQTLLKYLKKKKYKKFVFVPGISADLNTGGFVNKYPDLYTNKLKKNEILKIIREYSFNLFSSSFVKKLTNPNKKIELFIDPLEKKNNWQALERWISEEKVSKYIANSVRNYEFLGASWWMPFWDKEFIYFWNNLRLNQRSDQLLYKSLICKLSRDLKIFSNQDPTVRDGSGLFLQKDKEKKIFFIKKLLLNFCPKYLKIYISKFVFVRKKLASKHNFCWFSLFSKNEQNLYFKFKPYNILSFISLNFLIKNNFISIIKNKIKINDIIN